MARQPRTKQEDLRRRGLLAANDTVWFFENCLVHFKGRHRGQPFKLLRWQKEDLIKPLFGTIGADGWRLFDTAVVSTAKKQGKSALGSGFGLKLMLADGEPQANVAICASSKKQGRIIFDEASQMVEESPVLRRMVDVRRDYLESRIDGSRLEVLAAEAPSSHGPNYSGLILDEVHTWEGRDLYDSLTHGTIARDQPLTIALSTAGTDQTSLWYELYKRAKDAQKKPKSDPHFFGLIYEAPEKCAIDDREAWRMANPSLGHTIMTKAMEKFLKTAQRNAAEEAAFRQLHLNQWVSNISSWISGVDWDLLKDEPSTESEE